MRKERWEVIVQGHTLCGECGLRYIAKQPDAAIVSVIDANKDDGGEKCDKCGCRIGRRQDEYMEMES